jgi:aryl-alcohol dehydrogenase-like predicted oxidoreductase
LEKLAKDTGISLPQLALAWCLKNPHVSTVILGASKKNHLLDNIQSLEKIHLITPELNQAIELILDNKPVLAGF